MHIFLLVTDKNPLESAEGGEWPQKLFDDQSPQKYGIELFTPGSTVRLASNHATRPGGVALCYI